MKSAIDVQQDLERWSRSGIQRRDFIILNANDMIGWPYAWGATGQSCTVANREARMRSSKISEGDIKLIKKHCQVLNDTSASCAGCIYFPGGQRVNMHDCIAFINKLLDNAGVEHYGAGCSIMWNHDKNWEMKGKLSAMPETLCLVFQQQGSNKDKMDHIGLYIGDGWVIHCSVEVKLQKLQDYPWTHFAVPKGLDGVVPVMHNTVRRGDSGPDVVELQQDLILLEYDLSPYGADGKFGKKTEDALKAFQRSVGLTPDGVAGKKTWAALDEAVGYDPEPLPPETLYTVIIPHLTVKQAEELQNKYPDAEKRKEG